MDGGVMGSSPPPRSRLTPLQKELLTAFFARDQRTFLTGGAALAGFYLGHRSTDDLELFALPDIDLDDIERSFRAAAATCNGIVRGMQSYPDFRRLLVERGSETCKVDLVVDRAPPIERDKPVIDGVRLDSKREIAANKICALVSRAEIRDLVDLQALLDAGVDLDVACTDALVKDGGADPATLAWLLDSLVLSSDARLPADTLPEVLAAFRDDLVARLRAIAFARASRR
jgi:hypothetical protein